MLQPAVQPKKFVYLKSGWPDMRCPVALLEFVPNVSQSVTWWVYGRIVNDFCYRGMHYPTLSMHILSFIKLALGIRKKFDRIFQ